MQADTLISIVIPTYRRADMLVDVLKGVRAQVEGMSTPELVEVLVIDNCPDQTAREAVASYDAGAMTLRYVHEAQSGVANARNTGVASASGRFVVFLDDDELPAEGWLDTMAAAARSGLTAGFGKVTPLYETPPETARDILDTVFSRHFDMPSGTDLSDYAAYLGTGNSIFEKSACFDTATPFDPAMNATGGEDVWFIRRLVEKGIKLTWLPDADVAEVVPSSRMTIDYLKRRKFANGQVRCIVIARSSGASRVPRLLLWFGVGIAQTALYAAAGALAALISPGRADSFRIKMHGGLGKVFWLLRQANPLYGGS